MFEVFDRLSKPFVILACAGLIGIVGILDYLTGYEISFGIFYFLPIFLATLALGRRAGVAVSLLCAVVFFFADYLYRQSYPHPLILYWNSAVYLGFFLIVVFAVSALHAALERERGLSRIDSLTQIANHKAFYEVAEKELARARRYRHTISLAFIDCDDFKAINDDYGHHLGDEVLRAVAGVIQENKRGTDLGARMGGDEFVILMPETGQDAALEALTRLQAKLAQVMEQQPLPVTLSIGLATFQEPPLSADEMLKRADLLMYAVKREGKSGIKKEVVG